MKKRVELLKGRKKKPSLDGTLAKVVKQGREGIGWKQGGWDANNEYIRVSKLSDLCVRQSYYAFFDPKEPEFGKVDFASEMRMQIGTDLHEYLQDNVLGPMGLLCGIWFRYEGVGKPIEKEGFYPQDGQNWRYKEYTLIDQKHKVKGHIDGLICLKRLKVLSEGGDPYTVTDEESDLIHLEIKTTSTRGVQEVARTGEVPSYYKVQSSYYGDMCFVDRTMFLYMDRDTCRLVSFIVQKDEELVEEIQKNLLELHDHIERKVVPENKICRHALEGKDCPWYETCLGDGL